MSLKIIADENIDYKTINILRTNGYTVISIKEDHRGLKDKQIISLAKKINAIILTQDKDFGEWVFSFQEKNIGIVLLRYAYSELEKINNNLLTVINKHKESLSIKFVVISKNKIRIRNIF